MAQWVKVLEPEAWQLEFDPQMHGGREDRLPTDTQ